MSVKSMKKRHAGRRDKDIRKLLAALTVASVAMSSAPLAYAGETGQAAGSQQGASSQTEDV